MEIPRVDQKNLLGLVDKVIGLGKEIVGTVLQRDELAKAGRVQQDKGTERIKALQAQAKAEGHKAKAAAADESQRSAQQTKEAVSN